MRVKHKVSLSLSISHIDKVSVVNTSTICSDCSLSLRN